MKKIRNMIMDIVTCLLIVSMTAVGIMLLVGIRPYITMSGSMEPEIQTGSICFVNTRASFYDVEQNDIIAFETSSGTLVTHRVIGAEENGMILVTKGDNNDVEDGPTTTVENFRGKTLFSIPYVGYLFSTFQKTQYQIMAGILSAALLALAVIDFYSKSEAPC